jgi:hypothetical protein
MLLVIVITLTAALLWGTFYLAGPESTRRSDPPEASTLPASVPRQAVRVVALLTDDNRVLIGYIPVAADTGGSCGIAMVEPSAYGTIVLELLRDDPAVLATLERWCRSRAAVSFCMTESGQAIEMRESSSSTRLVLSGRRAR